MSLLNLPNLHPPLPQLPDVLRIRHRLVGCAHAPGGNAAVHLHQPRDGQRIAGGAHHPADAAGLIVVVQQLPRRAAPVAATHLHPQGDQIAAVGLGQLGRDRGDERVARHDLPASHLHRRQVEEPEVADRPHHGHVAWIAERLVFHRPDLALVRPGERRDAAARVEGLELAHRRRKHHGLDVRQRLNARRLAAPQHPVRRRVVVERTFQGVHDLVVERRIGVLWQPSSEDLHGLRVADAPDPLGRQDVHHAGREPAIGDHGDVPGARFPVELLLVEDDLRVAAEVGAVQADLDRGSRDLEVEVIRQSAEHRVVPVERRARAALELFTTQGYHGTTTPLIAKKAGVAEGSIYRHFDGKQHLLNELYRGAARWAGKLVKETDGLQVGPREKLAELARALVQGAAREPAVARLFLLQRHDALLDEESRKAARDFRLGLESLIAQGKADGTVKLGAAEVWAAVWLSVVSLGVVPVSAKEWPETHAGVTLALDGAWDAIAETRRLGA